MTTLFQVLLDVARTCGVLVSGTATGGTDTDVCTFAAVGDSVSLLAWGGKWYTTGVRGVTIA